MKYTYGEFLVDVATSLQGSRLITVEDTPYNDVAYARIKLALLLKRKPAILLRAIVEEWSIQDIVREVY
jgi:hypothetical protein